MEKTKMFNGRTWRLVPLSSVLFGLLALSCMLPNTQEDPFDPYAEAVRRSIKGDFVKAADILRPLLDKEDCDAEYRMGMMHLRGWGVKQDRDRAVALWRKAAAGNHPKAQAAMGDLHYQNADLVYNYCVECGIEADLVQAYVWYRLMQKSSWYSEDKKYAETMAMAVAKELTPDQFARGESLVREWKPVPEDCKPRHWW